MAKLPPHYIDVDLKKNTQYSVPVVTQNDTATHFIIRVTDDGLTDPELLDAYQEITMTSQRPDGESFYLAGTRIPGTNEIKFHLGTDETASHGSVLASLQFYLVEDASRYTSAQFRYDVKKDLTKNYTPTQREETLVEVVLRDGPDAIREAREAKQAVDGALVELEQDKTAAIDRLDEVTEENKTVFRQPVATFADLATTYPSPEHGTTVRVTSEAASYRYSDGNWVKTDEYNPTAIDQVTAQLAETAKVSHGVSDSIRQGYYEQALVSFVFDDAPITDYTKFKPIFESEKVPGCCCVVNDWVGQPNRMTWEQIRELKDLGWTVASHTMSHPAASDISEAEIEYEYGEMSRVLKERGFDHDIIVYPFGSTSETSLKVARKYYKMGININRSQLSNQIPFIDNLNMTRIAGLSQPEVFDGVTREPTLAECKARVDLGIANKEYMIFEDHSLYPIWDAVKLDELQQLIQYIKSKGIPIVNLQDGFNMKANIIDVKSDKSFYKLFRNGQDTKSGYENYTYDANTPITDFPSGTSSTYFNTSQISGKGFPLDYAGTVTTVRISSLYGYGAEGYQTFMRLNQSIVYMRRWNSTGAWMPWEIIAQPIKNMPIHLIEPTMNHYAASVPYTGYPRPAIVTSIFNNAGSTGFPVTAGVLTTYSLSSAFGYNKQEVKDHNSNATWIRTAKADLTWGDWALVTDPVLKGSVAWNPPIIANGEGLTSSDISVPGAAFGDHVLPASPVDLQGIMISAYVSAPGIVKIRLHNATGVAIDLAGGTWRVKVSKP